MEYPPAGRAFSWFMRPAVPVAPILLLFVADPRPVVQGCLRFGEEPRAYVVRYGLQPRVADALAVGAAHVRRLVPHDAVAGHGVFRLVGHRSEDMTDRVKPQALAAVNVQLLEQLAEFQRHRGVAGVARPA